MPAAVTALTKPPESCFRSCRRRAPQYWRSARRRSPGFSMRNLLKKRVFSNRPSPKSWRRKTARKEFKYSSKNAGSASHEDHQDRRSTRVLGRPHGRTDRSPERRAARLRHDGLPCGNHDVDSAEAEEGGSANRVPGRLHTAHEAGDPCCTRNECGWSRMRAG